MSNSKNKPESQEVSEKSEKDSDSQNVNKLSSAESEKYCTVCKSVIIGKMVSALGKLYHPQHFVCCHCKMELSDKFMEKEGKIYCEKDYHNIYTPKCARCENPILEKCVTALDKLWHPEHFQCEECGQQFGENTGFHEKDVLTVSVLCALRGLR
ncbi:leupaxin-like [Centruroides sculpturatus]|uniref:leupaxin-like n=1 Tax=Centruroides sculpturatus TaxID=218467 RepID=UPI000C6E21D4|nr:leupaxin-like [Centruroides sculpturatus]